MTNIQNNDFTVPVMRLTAAEYKTAEADLVSGRIRPGHLIVRGSGGPLDIARLSLDSAVVEIHDCKLTLGNTICGKVMLHGNLGSVSLRDSTFGELDTRRATVTRLDMKHIHGMTTASLGVTGMIVSHDAPDWITLDFDYFRSLNCAFISKAPNLRESRSIRITPFNDPDGNERLILSDDGYFVYGDYNGSREDFLALQEEQLALAEQSLPGIRAKALGDWTEAQELALQRIEYALRQLAEAGEELTKPFITATQRIMRAQQLLPLCRQIWPDGGPSGPSGGPG